MLKEKLDFYCCQKRLGLSYFRLNLVSHLIKQNNLILNNYFNLIKFI